MTYSSLPPRRTPLKRTPLAPGGPLERRGGLDRSVPSPRKAPTVTGAERAAKALVRKRSGGISEVTGNTVVRVDWSHRIGRAQGGPWAADNGVHMTRLEHGWLTLPKNRTLAEAGGWVLRSWQDPAEQWPVYLPVHGGWVLLHPDGTHSPAPWQPAPTRGPWEVWR